MNELSLRNFPRLLLIFTAMKQKRSGKYILNARNQLMEGDMHFHFITANTLWEYTSANGTETIEAAGPTNSEIAVLVRTNHNIIMTT